MIHPGEFMRFCETVLMKMSAAPVFLWLKPRPRSALKRAERNKRLFHPRLKPGATESSPLKRALKMDVWTPTWKAPSRVTTSKKMDSWMPAWKAPGRVTTSKKMDSWMPAWKAPGRALPERLFAAFSHVAFFQPALAGRFWLPPASAGGEKANQNLQRALARFSALALALSGHVHATPMSPCLAAAAPRPDIATFPARRRLSFIGGPLCS
jgi:hypothetical protein